MKRNRHISTLFNALVCFGVLLSLLLMSGCSKTIITGKPDDDKIGSRPIEESIKPIPRTTIVRPAPSTPKEFYELGEYVRAERLAGDLIANPNLSPQERSEAWLYYALSAAANNHAYLAQQALQNWAESEPGIENSTPWKDAWLGVTLRFSTAEAKEKAKAKDVDGQSATMRARAQTVYALKSLDGAEIDAALGQMQVYYKDMSGQEKGAFERIFADQLRWQTPQFLGTLYGHINTSNATLFPYTIINLEQGRRMLFSTDANYKQSGKEILESLATSGVMADSTIATNLLAVAQEQESLLQTLPVDMPSEGTVVLLLPLQGRYGPFAEKISTGAQAAQYALAQNGVSATVIVIDTETPDWMQKVAALPKNTVIGGPLTPVAYDQAKIAGLFEGRAVFTFLSQLDAEEEGVSAWRFFSSPQDQVSTLMSFCRALGVSGVGSLYPDDSYGQRMNTSFSTEAGKLGINTTSKSYAAGNPDVWSIAVREFLQARKGTSLEAVFLPDSWPNAKGLLPYFFFNREDRLIIMGTALWEQSLYTDRSPDARYFYLGVFPGAWNNESNSPAKQSLVYILNQMNSTPVTNTGSGVPEIPVTSMKADLWYALGFDFVRFAMSMGQPEESFLGGASWGAGEVNTRIQRAQNINWSMASMQWDGIGRVSQNMFLFNPTEDGFAPVDIEEFKKRISETKRLHTQRWSEE